MSMESSLEEFVRVVELGSVSGAARALGVPRASIGRRLARLEAEHGVQLLHRDTHRQALTEAGAELYRRARKIVAELAEARQAVQALDGVPRGLLRVGMPSSAGVQMVLAEAMLAACPEVELEFVATHTHTDLLQAGIDVALRAGQVQDETLIGRKLLDFANRVYAAPKLLEARGWPTLATLADYPCVLGFDAVGRPVTTWPLWGGGATPVRGRVRSNLMESRVNGARMGLGLVLASERLVRPWLANGELICVLESQVGFLAPVTLVWRPTAFLDPKIRAFVDIAVQTIGALVQRRDAEACQAHAITPQD